MPGMKTLLTGVTDETGVRGRRGVKELAVGTPGRETKGSSVGLLAMQQAVQ